MYGAGGHRSPSTARSTFLTLKSAWPVRSLESSSMCVDLLHKCTKWEKVIQLPSDQASLRGRKNVRFVATISRQLRAARVGDSLALFGVERLFAFPFCRFLFLPRRIVSSSRRYRDGIPFTSIRPTSCIGYRASRNVGRRERATRLITSRTFDDDDDDDVPLYFAVPV